MRDTARFSSMVATVKTKLNETIAIRSAVLRAKIDEMSARSGVKMSEIIRAALEVGLPVVERDGIRRTFSPALPLAELAAAKKKIAPQIIRIRKENTKP